MNSDQVQSQSSSVTSATSTGATSKPVSWIGRIIRAFQDLLNKKLPENITASRTGDKALGGGRNASVEDAPETETSAVSSHPEPEPSDVSGAVASSEVLTDKGLDILGEKLGKIWEDSLLDQLKEISTGLQMSRYDRKLIRVLEGRLAKLDALKNFKDKIRPFLDYAKGIISTSVKDERNRKFFERIAARVARKEVLTEGEEKRLKTLMEKTTKRFLEEMGIYFGGEIPFIYNASSSKSIERGENPKADGRFAKVAVGSLLRENKAALEKTINDHKISDPMALAIKAYFLGEGCNNIFNNSDWQSALTATQAKFFAIAQRAGIVIESIPANGNPKDFIENIEKLPDSQKKALMDALTNEFIGQCKRIENSKAKASDFAEEPVKVANDEHDLGEETKRIVDEDNDETGI